MFIYIISLSKDREMMATPLAMNLTTGRGWDEAKFALNLSRSSPPQGSVCLHVEMSKSESLMREIKESNTYCQQNVISSTHAILFIENNG